MTTQREDILRAAACLRAGGLVGMPTETVYGLAADACNSEAVANVFLAKERPHSHPLIVHLADFNQMTQWAREIPPYIRYLAEAFWPGPLTLILKKRPEVLDIVTGGQDTVALRVPRHPVALALLQAFGGGLVAPSANRFTRVSPTTAAAVKAELGTKVDMILDGGHCEVGLESSILDVSGKVPRILRPGMISPAAIEAVLKVKVEIRRQDFPDEIRVPGMHHLHYAPATRTELITATELEKLSVSEACVCLTYSGIQLPEQTLLRQVVMSSDPVRYAQDLYAVLRAQDQNQYLRIYIEAVPETAAWDAIRDRLVKACGTT